MYRMIVIPSDFFLLYVFLCFHVMSMMKKNKEVS